MRVGMGITQLETTQHLTQYEDQPQNKLRFYTTSVHYISKLILGNICH